MLSDKNIVRYAFGLAALVFCGYVVLDAMGKDVTQLFTWITGMASMGVSLLVYSKQHETNTKVDAASAKVDEVNKQVNGRMTQLITAKTLPIEGVTNGTSGIDPTV